MAEYDPRTENIYNELTCCVCLELLDNPVTLCCTHSLCKLCLQNVRCVGDVIVDIIKCPVCRTSVDLGNDDMLKKNLVLKRIIGVYKDDLAQRMSRYQSCPNVSTPQDQLNGTDDRRPLETSTLTPLRRRLDYFCKRYNEFNDNRDNRVLRPSGSVLELRDALNPDESASVDDTAFLTKCTALCDPTQPAAILCSHCQNQFCRLCWHEKHNLSEEKNQGHNLKVYISAFQDEQGNDIQCNICDPQFPKPAKFICFHCNVNFCDDCYQKRHPVLLIQHFIVQRPIDLPKQKPCSFCTTNAPKLASSICNACKQFFCSGCLTKNSRHCCLGNSKNTGATMSGLSLENIKIQRELVSLMQLKKQLVEEIPRFFDNKVSKPRPSLKLGDRVVYFEDECHYKGVVKWIGKLPEDKEENVTVGIEFNDPVGNGGGLYNEQRLFECRDEYAAFIPLLQLIKEADYRPNSSVQHDEVIEVPSSTRQISDNEENLQIGDLVAYPFHGRFCKGVVKWIGILPDSNTNDFVAGVEFDEAIGTGSGKYRSHRLFYAKINHAALVPIIGLLRCRDLEEQNAT